VANPTRPAVDTIWLVPCAFCLGELFEVAELTGVMGRHQNTEATGLAMGLQIFDMRRKPRGARRLRSSAIDLAKRSTRS